MATLAAPTLERVTEGVGVGFTAQNEFKHHLAQFASDDVGREDDEASLCRWESGSEQELESPERDEASEHNLAQNIPNGGKNESNQSNKRKATSGDEEHDEQEPPTISRPSKQTKVQTAALADPALADSTKEDPVVSVPAHEKPYKLTLEPGGKRTAASPSAGLALGKELDGSRTLGVVAGVEDEDKPRSKNEVIFGGEDEDEQDPATIPKQKKKRKELASDAADEDQRLETGPKRSRVELNISWFQKVIQPLFALSAVAQKKQKHIEEQLAFHHSGKQDVSARTPRNAVLDKIAELEQEIAVLQRRAEKITFKQSVKTEKTGNGASDSTLPSDLIEGLIEEAADKAAYLDELLQLSTEPSTQEQMERLDLARLMVPRFPARVASSVSGYRGDKTMTNGRTRQNIFLPSAATKKEFHPHAILTHLSQGEIKYMFGLHLAWLNPKHDEFLSFTNDILFLLIHALNRFHTGQRGVTIQYVNRDKAVSRDGKPARFYYALDIYSIFDLDAWRGWRGTLKAKLLPRKFTHEIVSHGIVLHNDPTLKQARLEKLISDGLFGLMPGLSAPNNHVRCGLYAGQVLCRRIGYPPRKPYAGETHPPTYSYGECSQSIALTTATLQLARKLALGFIVVPAETDPSTVEPPLHIFLQLLTLYKRNKADPVFMAWIKERYDGKKDNV
jgi:hypothetical protein